MFSTFTYALTGSIRAGAYSLFIVPMMYVTFKVGGIKLLLKSLSFGTMYGIVNAGIEYLLNGRKFTPELWACFFEGLFFGMAASLATYGVHSLNMLEESQTHIYAAVLAGSTELMESVLRGDNWIRAINKSAISAGLAFAVTPSLYVKYPKLFGLGKENIASAFSGLSEELTAYGSKLITRIAEDLYDVLN